MNEERSSLFIPGDYRIKVTNLRGRTVAVFALNRAIGWYLLGNGSRLLSRAADRNTNGQRNTHKFSMKLTATLDTYLDGKPWPGGDPGGGVRTDLYKISDAPGKPPIVVAWKTDLFAVLDTLKQLGREEVTSHELRAVLPKP